MPSASAPRAHIDLSLAAILFAGGVVVLTTTALVSPYWLWLNDEPGFTSSGAETLLDRYQGLWYSCEFVIEGTLSGEKNIERRSCNATANLVDDVSRPASLTTVQAFTWIAEIAALVTCVLVWFGLNPVDDDDEAARLNTRATCSGAATSAVTSLCAFIALLVYISDPYVIRTGANAANPDLYGWGSGVACIACAFVGALIVAVLALFAGRGWSQEVDRILKARMRTPTKSVPGAASAGPAPASGAGAYDAEAPAPAEGAEDDDDTAHAAVMAEIAGAEDDGEEEAKDDEGDAAAAEADAEAEAGESKEEAKEDDSAAAEADAEAEAGESKEEATGDDAAAAAKDDGDDAGGDEDEAKPST